MRTEPAPPRTQFLVRGADRLAWHVYPEPDHGAAAEPAATTGAATAPGPPMVVIWPAMGVPARYYHSFARSLRSRGLAVVVVDLRGTGASTPAPDRRSGYGYRELVDDVDAVLGALEAERAGRPLHLLGHSLGGQLCLLHTALRPERAATGLILIAVGLPYWRLYADRRRRYGVLPFSQGIAATSAALRVWPGWGFGGRQARGVIRDWAFTARTGRFPVLGGVDAEAAVRRVRTPVLAVSVDDDQFTPASTVDHLSAKLTAAPLRRAHYTAAAAGERLDHFRWVRAGDRLAGDVAAFTLAAPR